MRNNTKLQSTVDRKTRSKLPERSNSSSTLSKIMKFSNLAVLLALASPAEGCHMVTPHAAYSSDISAKTSIPEKKRYVGIVVHNIKMSDGTGGASDEQINKHLSSLQENEAFKIMNIEFQHTATEEIKNDDLHYFNTFSGKTVNKEALEDFIQKQGNIAEKNAIRGQINIFFIDNIEINVGALAMTLADGTQTVFVTYKGRWEDKYYEALPHEIGHLWGLFHTDAQTLCKELADGSTSERCGDFLPTPADPGPWTTYNPQGCKYNQETCTVISCGVDEDGRTYEPEITNRMSMYPGCRRQFSSAQIATMNHMLLNTERGTVVNNSPLQVQ